MRKHLLDAVPGRELGAVLQPYLQSVIILRPEQQEQFKCAIDSLFTAYPGLAARLVRRTGIAAEHPELAGWLLAQACQRASPAVSGYLQKIGQQAGLEEFLPGRGGSPFTRSQADALKVMRAMAQAYFEGAGRGALTLRFNPLLVGPSGVGKTFLVSELGRELNLPVLKLTVGEWLVVGAKGTPALGLVQRFICDHERGLIHLDELDKYRADRSPWMMSVMTEVFGLLDRSFHYAGEQGPAWTNAHAERLKRNVFIIGSGTWQEIWRNAAARPVGFNSRAPGFNAAQQVREARLIPEELVNRFNDPWLILDHYTAEDFRRLGREHGLVEPEFDPIAAAASKLNFRYLENAATRREIARRLAEPSGP